MTWAITDYEGRVRQLINDTSTSNRVIEELTNAVVGGNGSRTVFPLSHRNLVAGVMCSTNGAAYSTSGFTVDTANGLLTFTVAPSLSTTTPTSLTSLYYWQNYTNTELDKYIDYGLQKIGVSSSASAGLETVTEPLFNVVTLYAASAACLDLSGRYSRMVDMNAEGKSASASQIAKQYLELAKTYEDRAEKERLAVYGHRQGRSTAVSSTSNSFQPTSYTWNPSR